MLALLEKQVCIDMPGILSLSGKVKPDNKASVRVFEKKGYTEETGEAYIQFTKVLS